MELVSGSPDTLGRLALEPGTAIIGAGLATYLDVLSAEDGLLSSQRELANLQTRLFSLHVALVRALGGGYQTQA